MLAGLDLLAGARFTELPDLLSDRGQGGRRSEWAMVREQFSQLQTYNQQTMYVAEYHVTKVEHHN